MENNYLERARELVSQMTLEEKTSMTSGIERFRMQGCERLGLPALAVCDGPHGLRKQEGAQDHLGLGGSKTATCFPAACAVGSSFDPGLISRMGKALAEICHAEDVAVLLGPGINMKRHPLCGRNFEYFSEDPVVAGTMGAAYVNAVQREGIGTSLKHYLANNQETRRRTQSTEADERTLRELYMPAFEQVVKEASPWTVMASYNRIHGTYATESSRYMKEVLRGEWGYDGMVVSDWSAVHDRVKAVDNGCDLTMPDDKTHDHLLVEAVQNGILAEANLDAACERIAALILKVQAHHMDGVVYDYEAGHALAREVAAESMVLLKNEDHILPLDACKKIALFGKFAAEPRYQGAGSSKVNPYAVPSLLDVTKDLGNVSYLEGFGFGDVLDEAELENARKMAAEAEVAVIVAGLPASLESEGYDRWVMKLPRCQNRFIEEICAVQPNTVVVLQNGSTVEMPWVEKPKAILEAYLGGEAVCEAIWDVLTGAAAPSGHLAETFPKRLEDTPCYLWWPGEGDRVEYREGVFMGYRYYSSRDMEVLFPFGHGLTYTDFAYSNLRYAISGEKNSFTHADTLTVSVDVTNVGNRAGKALVQLYVGAPKHSSQIRRPVRELRGFEKVTLAPGETMTVTIALNKRAFSIWDLDANSYRMPGGTYTLEIGSSAQEILLSQEIAVEDEFVPSNQVYNLMTPICDMMKHPVGKAFVDGLMPQVRQGLKHIGMDIEAMRKSMPYGDQWPGMDILMTEPMQTLQRMAPQLTEAFLNGLFDKMNRK